MIGQYERISPQKAKQMLEALQLTDVERQRIKNLLPGLLNEETTNQ